MFPSELFQVYGDWAREGYRQYLDFRSRRFSWPGQSTSRSDLLFGLFGFIYIFILEFSCHLLFCYFLKIFKDELNFYEYCQTTSSLIFFVLWSGGIGGGNGVFPGYMGLVFCQEAHTVISSNILNVGQLMC